MKSQTDQSAGTNGMRQLLRPECRSRVLDTGCSCIIRPVPPRLKDSHEPWILPVQCMHFSGGYAALPSTIASQAPLSILERARGFLAVNYPDALRSVKNPAGILLESTVAALGWVIVEGEKGPAFRLLLESGLEGRAGRRAGLGYEIYSKARGRGAIASAADPEDGVCLLITRKGPSGHSVRRLHRSSSSVSGLIARMSARERGVLCPPEKLVNVIGQEEEMAILSRLLPPELMDSFLERVRTTVKRSIHAGV